ncbi:MAG: aldo/keto reductase [Spirochaetia bacterium]|jgi:aryl-alcohol dehydrogenase-like predicted oxidoreductase
MTYRRLERAGIEVSVVGLGCMSLGLDKSRAERILRRALDLGVTLFDTADLYDHGVNEELVGETLHGVRDKVVIATKVGNRRRPDGSGLDWDPTEKYILHAVRESLRRLRTDYIDLYQLHGGTIDDPVEETVRAFERLLKDGTIRAWGISSIRPNVVRRYAAMAESGVAAISSEMVQYSVLDRRPEEEILEAARRAGIGILVRGAVAGGLLAGKPPAGKPAAEYLDLAASEVEAAQEALRAISGSDKGMAQTAIRFALGHPAVTVVAAGASSVAQVESNVAAADGPPLSEADQRVLREAVRQLRYTSHR